ncbi:MAG: CapA family protein [Firmicutes bacterium]|nr:CapA family protein [Bacillota bacterium]
MNKKTIIALAAGISLGLILVAGAGIIGFIASLELANVYNSQNNTIVQSAQTPNYVESIAFDAEDYFETAENIDALEILEMLEIIETGESIEIEQSSQVAFFPTEPISPLGEVNSQAENVTTITISAAGDITLGGDVRGNGYHRFMQQFEQNGYAFFLANVRDIFYNSDLSIVNFEGTLTDLEESADKQYVFRAPPHFARILTEGAVSAVSLANNHTLDYLETGYSDTISALNSENIPFFGNSHNTIIEVNGVNIGLFGFRIWDNSQFNKNRITAAIDDLKNRGANLVIAYYHWGVERENIANATQREIAHHTVNAGANLVLGSHPHVIQGIEHYNGVNVVYSLANFSFGGNANPSDKDTFIFQQTFTFIDGELQKDNETNIIPALVSSVENTNNFQPTPATGANAERILERLRKYSEGIGQ